MTGKHGHHQVPKPIDVQKHLSAPAARAQEKALGIPDENTDEGALARLFLAEVLVPKTGDTGEARREMDMMHCVLINRLKHPADFDAGRYASTITQIITAREPHVQYQGFRHYPIIAQEQQDNIDDKLKIAIDGKHRQNAIYSNFVKTAIAAAKDVSPIDPTPNGLYFWVTTQSPRPSNDAVLFQTVGGNDFYTWAKAKPKGSR